MAVINRFQFVSEEQIKEAQEKQNSEGNKCPMCQVYGATGFIINADQWISCFSCNQTANRQEEPKKLELSEAEQTAYINSPNTCPFCDESDGLDATDGTISESGEMHQPVKCYNCKRRWTDVYVLQRIENIEDDED